jgi:hypothetical protein
MEHILENSDVIIDIDKLTKDLQKNTDTSDNIDLSSDYFYLTKNLVDLLELPIRGNVFVDKNTSRLLYIYDSQLKPVGELITKKKTENHYKLLISSYEVQDRYFGTVRDNKLYIGDHFVITLEELTRYSKVSYNNYNSEFKKVYDYYEYYISNERNDIECEITKEGLAIRYLKNPLVIRDKEYINCKLEFYVYYE